LKPNVLSADLALNSIHINMGYFEPASGAYEMIINFGHGFESHSHS